MKWTISKDEFVQAMLSTYDGGGFSKYGLHLLFDYLENYEEETGLTIEADPVSLYCAFREDFLQDLLGEGNKMVKEDGILYIGNYLVIATWWNLNGNQKTLCFVGDSGGIRYL